MRFVPLAVASLLILPAKIVADGPCVLPLVTFSVQDYLGNAASNGFSGMGNLMTMHHIADNFHLSTANAAPSMDLPQGCTSVSVPTRTKFEDKGATRNQMNDLRIGSGPHREESRFMLYAGHGTNGKFFLGQHPNYSYILPSDLNLGARVAENTSGPILPGQGGVRWFWANSCLAFNVPGSPSSHWTAAFNGLKAMLGYGTLTFDYTASNLVFDEFWESWAVDEYPLYMAFFNSQIVYNIETGHAIGPNCVSATDRDYCNESFRQTNFNAAAPGANTYYSVDIAENQYD